MPRTQFVTRYDFRAPGADPAARQEIFARAIEQAAYVDSHGMDALMVSRAPRARTTATSRARCWWPRRSPP